MHHAPVPASVKTFARGLIPLALVIGIMLIGPEPDSLIALLAMIAVSVAILWFGWSWIRANLTRWLGYIVATYIGLFAAMTALGLTLNILHYLVLLLPVLVALLVYDLFFRLPYQGRFARAREERRILRSIAK